MTYAVLLAARRISMLSQSSATLHYLLWQAQYKTGTHTHWIEAAAEPWQPCE